jgi:hypothetical protein
VAIITLFSAPAATAALLDGNPVELSYVFEIDPLGFISGRYIDVAGSSTPRVNPLMTVSLSDKNITLFNFNGAGTFLATGYNQFYFNDIFSTLDPIRSVEFGRLTNIAGLDANSFFPTAGGFYIDFSGLNFNSSSIVTINFNGAVDIVPVTVPEPQSWLIMAVGIGVIARTRKTLRPR